MKLTVKDVREILNYLDVVKSTTETRVNECKEGSYHEAMARQLERVTALIERLESMEV